MMGRIALGVLLSSWFCAFSQEELAGRNPRDVVLETPGSIVVQPDGTRIFEEDVKIGLPGVFLLTADGAVYNAEEGRITARGNIKIDFETDLGLVEVTAREINYQLESLSGTLTHITAQFGDDFFFVGGELEVLNEGDSFIIRDGTVTSCNQPNPQWSIHIKKATVHKEGYAFIQNAKFRIKSAPVLYLPYLIVPAMQDRRSGLLIPETGRSERNGSFYRQPIFWAPRQDLDFTIAPGIFDRAGFHLDLETRYKPKWDLSGSLTGQLYWDDVIDNVPAGEAAPREDGEPLETTRYRVHFSHDQQAFDGHLRIRADEGSDFSVDRDFLKETEKTRVRSYFFWATYDKDYGRSALFLNVKRLRRILSQNEAVQEVASLPDIRLQQPNRHIGGGFFLRNYAYAALFDLEDLGPEEIRDDLQRMGLESEISKTQNLNPFIHTRWGVGYKGAYYRQEALGSGETQGGIFGFIETVGPRFQRNYDLGSRRLVHFLDAIVTMKLGSADERTMMDGIFLDELDIRINEQVDGFQAAWKINSRLFSGLPGRVRPLLEMEIGQDIDLDSDDDENDTIDTRFRLLNLAGFHTNGIFEYNPDRGTLDTLSVYGSVNRGEWRGYGGYVRRRITSPQESFIGITELNLPAWRSNLRLALDYDFEINDIKSQELRFSYQGQCLGITLNYVRSPFDSRGLGNKDYLQLVFNLRNLGDLGTKF